MWIKESTVETWIDRIRGEYQEMPGLSLTRWQMRRLWLIDPNACDAALDTLVASGFLRRRPNDTFVRVGLDV